MTNKKLLLAFVTTLIFSQVFSQEIKPLRVKEIGLGLYNFENFSLQYRWGNEKRLFRLTGTIGVNTNSGQSDRFGTRQDSLTYHYSSYEDVKTPVNLNVGLGFSILKFKPLSDKFGFMFGPLLGLSYSYVHSKRNSNSAQTYPYSSTNEVKSQTFQPYLGIVLGAAYKINASFYIYAEIGPNLYYAFNQSYSTNATMNNTSSYYDESSSHNNSFGISNLSNSGAMLTLVYRFNK